MPSDDRTRLARESLLGPANAFRAAIANALERVRGQLIAQSATVNERVKRVHGELGPFASGRIDAARFSDLALEEPAVDPSAVRVLDLVATTLRELAARGDGLFHVDVPEGGEVRARIEEALAEVGRAFGAARVVGFGRLGSYRPTEHRRLLVAFPFVDWSPGERRMAPPLVVEIDGADLDTPALERFLDGHIKLALLARGQLAPAPLARLIGFGALVAQATKPENATQALEALAAFDGPGVVLITQNPQGEASPQQSEGSLAEFLYVPGADPALTLWSAPEKAPRKAIGGWSAAQMTAELERLRRGELGERHEGQRARERASGAGIEGEAGRENGAPQTPADPADRLAAWLFAQVES